MNCIMTPPTASTTATAATTRAETYTARPTSTATTANTTRRHHHHHHKPTSNNANIERQLREQILFSVDKILLKEPPSRASLLALLKLCNPHLSPTTLDNMVAREKAFRAVKARLHPDKFAPAQNVRTTQLFQNVQTYYLQCCHALADEAAGGTYRKRDTTTTQPQKHTAQSGQTYTRTNSPKSVVMEGDLPCELDIFCKWPHLKRVTRDSPYQAVSTSQLYYYVAYACLNLRGAVVHGQPIDCTYQVPVNMIETSTSPQSAQAVWAEAGLTSCKLLQTIDDIKADILQHGPVVSTSFQLTPQYYASTNKRCAGNFSERHVGQIHPLLITGWTMSAQGEVWCVQALRGPTFTIGMGQFGIDAACYAPPTSLLECKSWQAPGPYWDVADIATKCSAWRDHFENSAPLSQMEIMPLSSYDLENLADLWTVGLHAIIMERRTFVLRNASKMAQSRSVMLREMTRVPDPNNHKRKVWKVTLSVVRK